MNIMLLQQALRAAHYTVDDIAALIGEAGQSGLHRNQTMPARRALAGVDSPLATLTRLFILQQPQPRTAVEQVLGALDEFAEIIAVEGDEVRALVNVGPYSSPDDGADGWLVSDLTPNLDGMMRPVRPDYVLGASPASTSLAQLVDRHRVGSALDLGCGCGIQSLHLAKHADSVVATDLNPRACELSRLTFGLCGVDVDVREGSLYEPVAGERFNLIVSNPPYVMAPPAKEGEKLTYREGDMRGDDLVRAVVEGALDHLKPRGVLQVLGSWRTNPDHPEGLPVHLVQKAIDLGCDVRLTERERLSAYEYIELWLADAGLVGSPEYQRRYDDWLAYFEELGIDEIGMGWIWVRTPGFVRHQVMTGVPVNALTAPAPQPESVAVQQPAVRLESYPDPVVQPVGWAYGAWIGAHDQVQPVSAEKPLSDHVCATRYTVAEHVDDERFFTPGEEDPRHIVFRQRTGFARHIIATTELAAVISSCDGDLALGAIIDAVVQILDLDEQRRRSLERSLQEAIVDGFLVAQS